MARIVYSALATEIRGSIGGTTFQRTAYGFSAKNKSNMVKPASRLQNRSKQFLNWAVKGWSLLENADRASWNTFADNYPQYAKRNPEAQLSGFAAFVKWHAAFYLFNGENAGVTFEPISPPPAFPTGTISLTLDGSNLILDQSWNVTGGTYNVNIFATPTIPASQTFIGSRFRWLRGTENVNTSYHIENEYLALFGRLPAVGDKVGINLQLFPIFGGKTELSQQLVLIVQEA